MSRWVVKKLCIPVLYLQWVPTAMNILKTGWDLVWPFFVGWVRSSVLPWRPWIISLSTWARSSECVWWLMDGLMPWYSWMNMELNPNMQILRHDLWDLGWFMRLLWLICISDHTTRLPIPDAAPYGKSRSEMSKCWLLHLEEKARVKQLKCHESQWVAPVLNLWLRGSGKKLQVTRATYSAYHVSVHQQTLHLWTPETAWSSNE